VGSGRGIHLTAAAWLALLGAPASYAEEMAEPASAEEAAVTTETIPVAAAPDQDAAQPAASEGARTVIQEIVVTAQKREENLQDVPIAISAFSAEQLEAQGTETTKNLAQLTPGLTITELAGYTFIYLRGVGSDAFVASADPSVASYVDGIYVPIGHGFAQELGGVERVEVLKGPQGTLFGRNSTGGAINVTTKKPGRELEGSVGLSYAEFETYSAKAYVSIPLSDSFAFSVSGLLRGAESYYDRGGPRAERGIDDDRIKGFRVRARWNPSDTTELLLTGQRVDITAPGSLVSANRRPSELVGTALFIRPTTEDFLTEGDSDSLNQAYQTAVYGQFTWELPGFDIKLLGSDLLNDATALKTDFDGSPIPLISFFSGHEFTDIQTGELQLLSNADSWGSDWLTWVGGFFYLQSNAGFDPVQLEIANSVVQLPTDELFDLIPEGLRDLLPPIPLPNEISLYLEGLIETESKSGFAQATADLTDWFSLTLGGRYQSETREQTRSTVNLLNSEGGLTRLISFRPQKSTEKNFSPKVSLDFRPMDDVLVYTSWARGFKSHTYNIINIYTPPDYVKPEELTSYELGVKSTLFGNLRVNAAVFQNETKNLQSSFISLLAGGAVRLENAGKARSRGAELDVLWLPLPEIDPGLTLTFGAAYLDAIYTSFKDGSGFNETTGLLESHQDYSGNRITRTPEWTGNLGISQTIETGSGQIELGADAYYSDSYYFLPQNGDRSYEPSYSLLSARIGYRYEPWDLRLTVFGSNLTDERYNIAQFHTDFGRNDTMGPPRMFGARLQWEF
jgi:iron complex outermembrane receptor protein